MDMNAFFCITLSMIILRKWWVSQRPWNKPKTIERRKPMSAIDKQKEDDELITVILPIIKDGQ